MLVVTIMFHHINLPKNGGSFEEVEAMGRCYQGEVS